MADTLEQIIARERETLTTKRKAILDQQKELAKQLASAPVRPMPMAKMHRPGPRFLTSGFVLFGAWAQPSKQRPRRRRLAADFIQEIVECPSQRP